MPQISASKIKSFFQYRCERQLRLKMLPYDERKPYQSSSLDKGSNALMEAGLYFETAVIRALAREHKVRQPEEGQKFLTLEESLDALGQADTFDYIHQFCLKPGRDSALLTAFDDKSAPSMKGCAGGPSAEEDVLSLSQGFIDLVRVELPTVATRSKTSKPVFTIIDIKGTHAPTLYHRIQIAYYAILFEEALKSQQIEGVLSEKGEVWFFSETQEEGSWQQQTFRLRPYINQVRDFFSRTLSDITVPALKDSPFHVYFKCEQCEFLSHCTQSISDELGVGQHDVSAIPGLTQYSKACLLKACGRGATTSDVAALDIKAPLVELEQDTLEVLVERARSLLKGEPRAIPGRLTHRMPAAWDVGIFLLADRDPITGHLATIAALRREKEQESLVLKLVEAASADAEWTAIEHVMNQVTAWLEEVDLRSKSSSTLHRVHTFVFESSEAEDLAEALGRHLERPGLHKTPLMHSLRIFPPKSLQPDPHVHHHPRTPEKLDVPYTALRSVLDDVFALPVIASHDLATVSDALATTTPAMRASYRPAEGFKRPFSSRLALEHCLALKQSVTVRPSIEADVRARLYATAALADWIVQVNASADVAFLRLKKPAFGFSERFHPTRSVPLDRLKAREQLEASAGLSKTLSQLSLPAEVRTRTRTCARGLEIVASELKGKQRRLTLNTRSEISEGALDSAFSLLLSDEADPGVLLDSGHWKQRRVQIIDIKRDEEKEHWQIVVGLSDSIWSSDVNYRNMISAASRLCLDEISIDYNTPKIENFIDFLRD